jgi:hypothetical protein
MANERHTPAHVSGRLGVIPGLPWQRELRTLRSKRDLQRLLGCFRRHAACSVKTGDRVGSEYGVKQFSPDSLHHRLVGRTPSTAATRGRHVERVLKTRTLIQQPVDVEGERSGSPPADGFTAWTT